jgi:hypothetical protein
MGPIESALPGLWPLVVEIIDSFCGPGLIRTAPEDPIPGDIIQDRTVISGRETS